MAIPQYKIKTLIKKKIKTLKKSPRCKQPDLTLFPVGWQISWAQISNGPLGDPSDVDHHPPRGVEGDWDRLYLPPTSLSETLACEAGRHRAIGQRQPGLASELVMGGTVSRSILRLGDTATVRRHF